MTTLSTQELIDAVLLKAPEADPQVVLDLIVSCDANLDKVFTLLGKPAPSIHKFGLVCPKPARKRLVQLKTPEEVREADICCELILNALNGETADRLTTKLEEESREWPNRIFHLFGREVQSQHQNAIYADKTYENLSYQGEPVKQVFLFNDEMKTARDLVQSKVRELDPTWTSSIAVCNRYSNPSSKLDYHSDQLTHIGPKPIIAALSLGCTREFRLKDRAVPPKRPIYSIRVPHNSLLIMKGGCQELFKHCVPPDKAGHSPRISVTFRMYRQSEVPKCHCARPMIMRSTIPKDGQYKYIWMCGSEYKGGKSCNKVMYI